MADIEGIAKRTTIAATLKNEYATLAVFIGSLINQSIKSLEIVLVDGGSYDGTLDYLRGVAAENSLVKLIESDDTNISQGRNIAAEAARGDIIVFTDAGSYADERWLENLLVSLSEGDEKVIVGGYTNPVCDNFLQRLLACVNLPLLSEVKQERFMPSSRNIALYKSAWHRAGGYPEWLTFGEDMYFDKVLKKLGYEIRFQPGAVVNWHLHSDLISIFKQFFRYSYGDGIANMYAYRHALRFLSYVLLAAIVLFSAFLSWYILFVLVPLGAAYLARPYLRSVKVFKGKAGELISGWFLIPAMAMYMDIAKMGGYLYGFFKRNRIKKGVGLTG
ncbi:MAG: glycosyltransferase [Actinobacteria bacterium]|nr:glycosyltransferase [Actinomycetota bacterium]